MVPVVADEPSSSKHEAAKNTMTTVGGAAGAAAGSIVGGMFAGPAGAVLGGAVGGAAGAIGTFKGNQRYQEAIDKRRLRGGGSGGDGACLKRTVRGRGYSVKPGC